MNIGEIEFIIRLGNCRLESLNDNNFITDVKVRFPLFFIYLLNLFFLYFKDLGFRSFYESLDSLSLLLYLFADFLFNCRFESGRTGFLVER